MESQFAKPVRVLSIALVGRDAELLRDTLELAALPAEVIEVGDSPQILDKVTERPSDVAIVNLDAIDPARGRELLDRLRDAPHATKVPVIALSSSADRDAVAADYSFERPEDAGGYMGIVAAIKFYWLSASPSIPPAPTDDVRPRPAAGVDLMSLPIEPIEAYLLSVIDGNLSLQEIAEVLGTDLKRARQMVRRLADLGAVRWSPAHPTIAPPGQRATSWSAFPSLPAPPPAPGVVDALAATDVPPPPSVPEGAVVADTSETASEPAETKPRFDEERRRLVDESFAMVEADADHYELLGVPRDAPRKVVREAYFNLAKLFHTDSVYGEDLGAYRRKMDRVFQAITEAYEVLSRKKKRNAYNAYLAAFRATAELDAAVVEDEPSIALEPLAPPADAAPEEAAPAEDAAAAAGAPEPSASPEPESPSEEGASAAAPMAGIRAPLSSASSSAHRQRLADRFARSLRGSSVKGRRPIRPATDAKPDSTMRSLARVLTVMSNATGGGDRAARLLEDAKKAEAAGNLTGAATAMRLALKWRPHDAQLRSEAERLQEAAVAAQASSYEQRATYAEERQRWEEAALCWTKVAETKPDDVELARRAANAILHARGDLATGVRYARAVVAAEPNDAAAHRLLGELFLAAGKVASARRPLTRALELAPSDQATRDLLREVGSR